MAIKMTAADLHDSGYNCAQSVLCACGKYTGMNESALLGVSGGFGGGLRCGEICGAVAGAVMAIGLRYRYDDNTDAAAKEKIAELTREFTGCFQKQFGCLRCEELKDPEQSCNKFIEYAAQLAEEIILKNSEE